RHERAQYLRPKLLELYLLKIQAIWGGDPIAVKYLVVREQDDLSLLCTNCGDSEDGRLCQPDEHEQLVLLRSNSNLTIHRESDPLINNLRVLYSEAFDDPLNPYSTRGKF